VADGQIHDPVDLRVVDAGLRTAPHRVVVRRDGDGLAVQRGEPGDQTTGRLAVGARQHARLHERARVDHGVDALSGGEAPALMDPRHGFGAAAVVGLRSRRVDLIDRLVVHD
jgi:hypothetical protein